MPFPSFDNALSWARKHAAECCFAFQFWRVVKDERGTYRVAIYSRNTNLFQGYAF